MPTRPTPFVPEPERPESQRSLIGSAAVAASAGQDSMSSVETRLMPSVETQDGCLLLRQDSCLLLRQDRCLPAGTKNRCLLYIETQGSALSQNTMHQSCLKSSHLSCLNTRYRYCLTSELSQKMTSVLSQQHRDICPVSTEDISCRVSTEDIKSWPAGAATAASKINDCESLACGGRDSGRPKSLHDAMWMTHKSPTDKKIDTAMSVFA